MQPTEFMTDAIADVMNGAMSRVLATDIGGDLIGQRIQIETWCTHPNPTPGLSPYFAIRRAPIPSIDTDPTECNQIHVYLNSDADFYQRYHCCPNMFPCGAACLLAGGGDNCQPGNQGQGNQGQGP
jgi:hypothetical protein